MSRGGPGAARPVASFGAGLALAVPFLVPALAFVAWAAYVPLLDALEERVRTGGGPRAWFGAGYRFGLAFFLVSVHWIARLSDVAISIPWLKYPAWLAGAAYLALFPGLVTLAAGALRARGRVPLAAGFPLALVAVESLRGAGELGFPWFQPGYSQAAYGPVLQLASLGGVTLLTAWVAFVNVLAWRALAGRRRALALAGLGLLVAFPFAWGTYAVPRAPRAAGAPVALVQGNIAGEIKWAGTHQREILATFLRLSGEALAASPRPTLLVWPETATGSYLRRQPDQAIEVERFARDSGVPVFTGYADYEFDANGKPRTYNAAGLFGAGVPERYAKRHLVPFGERMPFQHWLPFLGKLELGQAEWTPGDRPVLFPSAAGPFGCLVCFESIFPDLARRDVLRGATWIAIVTNDEWFGESVAIPQHAAMARVRAVENRVAIARCANTGLTEVIDPWGRVTAKAAPFRAEVLHGTLVPPGPRTPFTRFGDWPAIAAVAALALLLVRTVLFGRAR